MMRSVLAKTLYELRWFTSGWTLGLMALAVLMASFFPAMRPEGGMDALLANMPTAFRGLIGSLGDMRQFDTFIASQLFDIRVPIIAGIMALIVGLRLGEPASGGEVRTLLGLPISRTKLYFHTWLAMAIVMLVAAVGLLAGVEIAMLFVEDAVMAQTDLILLSAVTWLLMLVFGTIAYGAGRASGNRGVASFVSTLVIIGSFLLTTFASAVSWLESIEFLSLLYYFPAAALVKSGVELADIAVLMGVLIVSLLGAWLVFRRRDV